MFKRILNWFSKDSGDDEASKSGFIVTISKFDEDLGANRTDILIVGKDEESNVCSMAGSEEIHKVSLFDGNILMYTAGVKSNIMLSPFKSIEYLEGTLKVMKAQGIKRVLGWDMPID